MNEMRIGIPKEIKENENRVGLTPAGAQELIFNGHEVSVETGAGLGSGFEDTDYVTAGAQIVPTSVEAWEQDMVVKVKEPLSGEFKHFRENLILFTYLHLAAERTLTEALVENKVISIAYETVQLADGSLPLLTPMSEVAGRMATQIGAQFLEKNYGGRGVLLAGIPGVDRGKVTIIGGGIVGTNAAEIAVGLGAEVTIIDLSPTRLRQLDMQFGKSVQTKISNPSNILDEIRNSDLVIGAVLIPGARAPKLVTDEMVQAMPQGSVVVDVAIDQGGIFETSDRMTTHADPTYEKHGVLHYAVANIPGAVPRTATLGLTNVTLPYISQVANLGFKEAAIRDIHLRKGFNTLDGSITNEPVAGAHDMPFRSLLEIWNM